MIRRREKRNLSYIIPIKAENIKFRNRRLSFFQKRIQRSPKYKKRRHSHDGVDDFLKCLRKIFDKKITKYYLKNKLYSDDDEFSEDEMSEEETQKRNNKRFHSMKKDFFKICNFGKEICNHIKDLEKQNILIRKEIRRLEKNQGFETIDKNNNNNPALLNLENSYKKKKSEKNSLDESIYEVKNDKTLLFYIDTIKILKNDIESLQEKMLNTRDYDIKFEEQRKAILDLRKENKGLKQKIRNETEKKNKKFKIIKDDLLQEITKNQDEIRCIKDRILYLRFEKIQFNNKSSSCCSCLPKKK